MTLLIQQKFTSDCAVACLAMFLGVDYEDVVKHCAGHELVWAGMANSREKHIAGLFDTEIVVLDRDHIDRTMPAVLTVPSLNASGERPSTHAVYWDTARIWDPNEGRPGKKTYTNQMAWDVAIKGYQRKEDRR